MQLILPIILLLQATKPEPPKITSEQRAAYWRSAAEAVRAQQMADKAAAALRIAIEAMEKTCGGTVRQNADGEPECAPAKEQKK